MKMKSFDNKIIVAGPCSIESREQIINTAIQLKETGLVSILRGGVYKPRTFHNTFTGVGQIGMEWMLEAKAITKIPIAVEVGMPEHVEQALKFGIDYMWIGAKTTVNPFLVDAIVHALKGTNQKVLIKNPVNPDLDTWVGAVDRFLHVGIDDLILVHRGFSSHEISDYRNQPIWEIPLAMKKKYPQFPMICDPSHIGGQRHLISEIVQKSADLDFDGWMIESHIDPNNALTDKKQQITPSELTQSLSLLINNGVKSTECQLELEKLRNKIDLMDEKMLHLISQRMEHVKEIGQIKKVNDLELLQQNRWEQVLTKNIHLANQLNLDDQFVKDYLQIIHSESLKIQSRSF